MRPKQLLHSLLFAANVSYHVGREPAATYGESLGGQWQSVSWKSVYQFCDLPVSPFKIGDDPNSGLLPGISPHAHGNPGEGDHRVQAYNFRMFLSNKEGKVAFPKPAGFIAARLTIHLNPHDPIRGMPSKKAATVLGRSSMKTAFAFFAFSCGHSLRVFRVK